MEPVMLNYTRDYYDKLLTKLRDDYNKLGEKIEILKNYCNQIDQFWKGKTAAAYVEILSTQIQKVKSAQSQLEEFIQTLQDALDVSERQSRAVKDVVDDMQKAVSFLEIGGMK